MAPTKQIGLVGFRPFSVSPAGDPLAAHRDHFIARVNAACGGAPAAHGWYTELTMAKLLACNPGVAFDIIVAVGRRHTREVEANPAYAGPVIMGPVGGDPNRFVFPPPGGIPARVKGVAVWNNYLTIGSQTKSINRWRVQKLYDALAGAAVNELAIIVYDPHDPPDDPPIMGGPGDHEVQETRQAIHDIFGSGTSRKVWRWKDTVELANYLNIRPVPDAAIVLSNFPNFWRSLTAGGTGGPRPMITQWAHDNLVPTMYPMCDYIVQNGTVAKGFISFGPNMDLVYDIVAGYVCDEANSTSTLPQVTKVPVAAVECCYSMSEATNLGLPFPAGCTQHP